MRPAAFPAPPLAVSMGEPAGIGTEILLAAWRHFAGDVAGAPRFFLIDDPDRVAALARMLGSDVPVQAIDDPAETEARFGDALPVLPLPEGAAITAPVTPGHPDPDHAPAVIGSLARGIALIRRGAASGLVTLPIQKASLQKAGFGFPGHTEFLEAETADMPMPFGGARGAVMMLTADTFRTVPVTVHLPLREVFGALTPARITDVARIVHQSLKRDYALPAPRLALAGLNPHAGEAGTLGREEEDIIRPAAGTLLDEGIDVHGPAPADTLFHEEARGRFDAILGMYHDQALIPIKTMAFHTAVNTTIGLPIVRTSPDHGTGLDIAGQGLARPDSLIAALIAAARMAAARASVR